MYVRFVLHSDHAECGVRVGPFGVAYDLRTDEKNTMCEVEWLVLDDTLDWFGETLPVPYRTYRWYKGWRDGYCWFRDSAREHILRMRTLAWVLERNGYPMTMIRGDSPGQVLYEDCHQIVAVPYRDSFVG
jgi:hypothetical protein